VVRGHDAFEEVPSGGIAVVAAGAQANRAFFPHRDVFYVRSLTVERNIEHAGLGIADFDRPVIFAGSVSLHHAGHEVVVEWPVPIPGGRAPGPETVLQITHHPRALASPFPPNDAFTEIDGLHGALAVVVAVSLHVSIIETATPVDQFAVDDHVLRLGVVAGR